MSMGKRISWVIAGASILWLAGCDKNHTQDPPKVQPVAETTITPPPTLKSMEEVNSLLADRVRKGHEQNDGYAVFVTNTAFQVGTILPIRGNGDFENDPVDYDACAPTGSVHESPIPNLFVNQSLSNTLAANFGIDNALIRSLADAGVDISRATSVNLSFIDPKVALLSQNEVKAIVAKPGCRTALGDKPAWVVRGYVIAKRNFVLTADRVLQAHGSVTGVAKFSFDAGSGKRTVSLVDDAPQNFIQILSKITPASGPGTTATTAPAITAPAITSPAIAAPRPTPAVNVGKIYIQKASADISDRPGLVLEGLRRSFSVEPRIQSLDARKIPDHAEVRYFNSEDEEKAAQARTKLLATYPDVRIVRVNLPSPKGQLEVWLPANPGSIPKAGR